MTSPTQKPRRYASTNTDSIGIVLSKSVGRVPGKSRRRRLFPAYADRRPARIAMFDVKHQRARQRFDVKRDARRLVEQNVLVKRPQQSKHVLRETPRAPDNSRFRRRYHGP